MKKEIFEYIPAICTSLVMALDFHSAEGGIIQPGNIKAGELIDSRFLAARKNEMRTFITGMLMGV